jgi:hypothetical protein
MKKNFMSIFPFIILCVLIISCGGDDLGGGAETFDTVYLYASYDDEIYEADVAIWTDETEDDGLCDGDLTYVEDDVLIRVTSDVYARLPDDIEASPVKIKYYTVQFTPKEDSPSVPTKQIYSEWIIEPDTTVQIPVRIIDQEDKVSFSLHPLNYSDYLDFVDAGGVSYEYTVTVSFVAEEVLSGTGSTIQTQFTLHYYDIDDGCT